MEALIYLFFHFSFYIFVAKIFNHMQSRQKIPTSPHPALIAIVIPPLVSFMFLLTSHLSHLISFCVLYSENKYRPIHNVVYIIILEFFRLYLGKCIMTFDALGTEGSLSNIGEWYLSHCSTAPLSSQVFLCRPQWLHIIYSEVIVLSVEVSVRIHVTFIYKM